MPISLASFAQYFRIGLELGIVTPDQVREWAISVIDEMDEPPGEIIEISWRKPRSELITDLNEVKGDADFALVRRWLLGTLSSNLPSADDHLDHVIRQAMGVARAVGDQDLYYVFDAIEDELQLARTQVYGTVEECRESFNSALREFGTAPFVT